MVMDDLYISTLNKNLLHAYKAEEEFWKQQSRQLWLTLGNRNTGYFHASTKGRRVRNRITILEDSPGAPVYEDSQIIKVISDYFNLIFTSTNPSTADIVNKALTPCISDATNALLISTPSTKELKKPCSQFTPTRPRALTASLQASSKAIGR